MEHSTHASILIRISEGLDPTAWREFHDRYVDLIRGFARRYGLQPREAYADACHLCDESRRHLRSRFPEVLTPDQMYGVPERG